jgi:protein-tyrosine phosphatase
VPIHVLFVCLGNICRSPAAHGVFQHLVGEAGLADEFTIASAGTGAWHTGERADARMRTAARRRGIELSSVARRVGAKDFEDFDHIFAMDAVNLQELRRRAPAGHRHKIRLFREFDPEAPGADVPDPYYGDAADFDTVLDIVTRTGRALLADLRPPLVKGPR